VNQSVVAGHLGAATTYTIADWLPLFRATCPICLLNQGWGSFVHCHCPVVGTPAAGTGNSVQLIALDRGPSSFRGKPC
jgi:hypothetical protein